MYSNTGLAGTPAHNRREYTKPQHKTASAKSCPAHNNKSPLIPSAPAFFLRLSHPLHIADIAQTPQRCCHTCWPEQKRPGQGAGQQHWASVAAHRVSHPEPTAWVSHHAEEQPPSTHTQLYKTQYCTITKQHKTNRFCKSKKTTTCTPRSRLSHTCRCKVAASQHTANIYHEKGRSEVGQGTTIKQAVSS